MIIKWLKQAFSGEQNAAENDRLADDQSYDPEKAFARSDEEITQHATIGLLVTVVPISLAISIRLFDDWTRIALWTAMFSAIGLWFAWSVAGDALFNGALNEDEKKAGRKKE